MVTHFVFIISSAYFYIKVCQRLLGSPELLLGDSVPRKPLDVPPERESPRGRRQRWSGMGFPCRGVLPRDSRMACPASSRPPALESGARHLKQWRPWLDPGGSGRSSRPPTRRAGAAVSLSRASGAGGLGRWLLTWGWTQPSGWGSVYLFLTANGISNQNTSFCAPVRYQPSQGSKSFGNWELAFHPRVAYYATFSGK